MKKCNCALDSAMGVIDGRWKTTILCMLYHYGPLRFSQLQLKIGVISSRMLSKQLKELESDNMIYRDEVVKGSMKVEYSLTSKGESIIPVLRELALWSLKNQLIDVIVPTDTVVSTYNTNINDSSLSTPECDSPCELEFKR